MKRPDLDIEIEFEKFVNHYNAATGRNAIKLNWELTFRNWVLNSRNYAQPKNNAFGGGRRNDQQVFAESAEFYRTYGDAGGDEPGTAE